MCFSLRRSAHTHTAFGALPLTLSVLVMTSTSIIIITPPPSRPNDKHMLYRSTTPPAHVALLTLHFSSGRQRNRNNNISMAGYSYMRPTPRIYIQ